MGGSSLLPSSAASLIKGQHFSPSLVVGLGNGGRWRMRDSFSDRIKIFWVKEFDVTANLFVLFSLSQNVNLPDVAEDF